MIRLRIRVVERTRDVELGGERVRFGRSPGCEVVLEAAGVSREHAELVRGPDGWRLRDLGSSNGTCVNGTAVQDAPVRAGDVVVLADDVTIEVLSLDDRSSARQDARGPDDPGEAADSESAAPPARVAPTKRGFLRRDHWRLVPSAGGVPLRLDGSIATFGREPGAGTAADHASVSRIHARADAQVDGWLLTDLKSANGTYVNDERVLRRSITAGDRVRFGDIEFVLERHSAFDVGSLSGALRIALVLIGVTAGVVVAVRWVLEREEKVRIGQGFRREAVASLLEAARAAAGGTPDIARGHLAHAADLMLIGGLAPEGASLARPRELFGDLLRALPSEAKDFDPAALMGNSALADERTAVAALDSRTYVEHELRRFSAELGQDPNLPPEFIEQVWSFVQAYRTHPGSMRQMLRRSRTLQPRIRAILAQEHLPESVAYVAWVESGLDSMQVSRAHAVGLWQLMAPTAREHGLHIDEQDLRHDDRTRVDRSTRAAARYLARMLRDQGPEYFMLVLASYNRGPNALRSLKQKIDDPMLSSMRKYWHLVERGMLTEETRMYVPKVFAIRIVAENPSRFGF